MNQKVTGKASSIPVGLAVGGFVSMLFTIIGAIAAAWLIGNEKLSENKIGYCAMVLLLSASYLGAWTAAEKIKHRRLYICVMSGLLYYVILLAINALFFGGQYNALGVTALLVLAGSICAALLKGMGSRGGKTRGAIRRHR